MKYFTRITIVFSIFYFCFYTISLSAQSDDSIKKYIGKAVYYVLLDENGKEISKKGVGKNPVIQYDEIYNRYTISYKNKNYISEQTIYDIDGLDNSSGLLRLNNKSIPFSDYYYADDNLSSEGILRIYYYGYHLGYQDKITGYFLYENMNPY